MLISYSLSLCKSRSTEECRKKALSHWEAIMHPSYMSWKRIPWWEKADPRTHWGEKLLLWASLYRGAFWYEVAVFSPGGGPSPGVYEKPSSAFAAERMNNNINPAWVRGNVLLPDCNHIFSKAVVKRLNDISFPLTLLISSSFIFGPW